MKSQKPSARSQDSAAKQWGFVSIIVAILLMVILALITIGFTRLMQREQRQALDRQLSRQALYAAESGINDALNEIAAGTNPDYQGSSKVDCDPTTLSSGHVLDATNDVEYTCILFDKAPGSLEYDIDADRSKIVQLESSSGNNFTDMMVTWGNQVEADNNVASLNDCGTAAALEFLPTRPAVVPVLKLDLSSVSLPYDRANLLQNTDYIYLVPCKNGAGPSTHSFNPTRRGNVVEVPCAAAGTQPCQITINNLAPASSRFFARIRPVYDDAAVSIAANDAGGAVQFVGAQIGVDVTARAGDVIRRLRVNTPFGTSGAVPEFVVQAFSGFCKQLNVVNDIPGSENIVDECNAPPPPPPPPPPPAGCGTSATFNYANYAETLFPIPPNTTFDRLEVNDVNSDTGNYSVPDYIVDETLGVEVDTGCVYEADFEVHCTVNWSSWGSPPTSPCLVGVGRDQVDESVRINLYDAPVSSTVADPYTNQCGGTKLAYFDVHDWTVNGLPTTHTGTRTVNLLADGDVACVELEHHCASVAPVPSPPPTECGVTYSSVFVHNFTWRPL